MNVNKLKKEIKQLAVKEKKLDEDLMVFRFLLTSITGISLHHLLLSFLFRKPTKACKM